MVLKIEERKIKMKITTFNNNVYNARKEYTFGAKAGNNFEWQLGRIYEEFGSDYDTNSAKEFNKIADDPKYFSEHFINLKVNDQNPTIHIYNTNNPKSEICMFMAELYSDNTKLKISKEAVLNVLEKKIPVAEITVIIKTKITDAVTALAEACAKSTKIACHRVVSKLS